MVSSYTVLVVNTFLYLLPPDSGEPVFAIDKVPTSLEIF